MQPTIKDVAALAGVGVGTASRVLNDGVNVSEQARKKVLAAVEQLGYSPNSSARKLRTGRSGTIGLCTRDIANPLFSLVTRAIEGVLETNKLSLLVGNSFGDPDRELEVVKNFLSQDVEGLILSPGADSGAHVVELAEAHNVPVVVLDRESPAPSTRIMTEHVVGLQQATDYLLDLGHRDIAIISGSEAIFAGRARVDGFRQAFVHRNLPIDESRIFHGSFTPEYGEEIATELLHGPNPPSAIICGAAAILLGVLPVVHAADISIPDQLSLISCDDIDLTRLYRPAITVVRRDADGIGKAAAKALVAQLGQPPQSNRNIQWIRTELVVRKSCAPLGQMPNS